MKILIKINKSMRKLLAIFILSLIFIPNIAKADGMIVPPYPYYVRETGQKAVIFHENSTETLILSVNFQGEAKDFGWVIPVPNKPEAIKGSDEIFISLAEITRPQRPVRITSAELMIGAASKEQAVTVIETKKIDYYDVAILSATDSQALAKWLKENGYQYPTESAYILNDYIDNNWYFVAIKISPEAQKASEVAKGLKQGHATPLKIVFRSEAIIYPLRISSISVEPTNKPYRDYVGINLYVIASHKKEVPGFRTQYADWIKSKEIKKLAYDINGRPLIDPVARKYFLTHLYRSMRTSEMTSDLILRDASDNKKVNAGLEEWVKWLVGAIVYVGTIFTWMLSPLGLAFIVGLIFRWVIKSSTGKVLSRIMQLFSLILTLILGVVILIIIIYNSFNFVNIPLLLGLLTIILAMILVSAKNKGAYKITQAVAMMITVIPTTPAIYRSPFKLEYLLVGFLIFSAIIGGWLISPLGVSFIAGSLVYFLVKEKRIKITALVFQIASVILTSLLAIGGIIYIALEVSSYNYQQLILLCSVALAAFLILFACIAVLIWQFLRREKVIG